jgi:toxin ParE1/3/4
LARVVFTPRARADLDDLWLHVALANPAAADRLIDRIVDKCQGLADYPQLGPVRLAIAPDARAIVVGEYLALYRVVGFDAVIVRIVHGARQLRELFDLGSDE